MRNYFTLDGVDSRTFGVYISGAGTYSAPARRYNVVQIPGRNGDLVYSDGTYENGVLRYNDCFIYDDIENNLANFRSFLMSRNGYVNLTDTYHPNERRSALFAGSFEPEMTAKLDAAKFDLEFNCKPQRWLLSGDTSVAVNSGETANISNPTRFPAKPLFTIYDAGSFDYQWIDNSGAQPLIVNNTITVSGVSNAYPTIIDCETGFIYYVFNGVYISRADKVTMSMDIDDIPANSSVTIKNVTASKVEITPRWWTL